MEDEEQRPHFCYKQVSWTLEQYDIMSIGYVFKCDYSVFEGKTMVLSEILRCEKFGWKRDSLGDIIVHCGGGVGMISNVLI